MNARQFFDKVSEMRSAQKEYIKFRCSTALTRSKKLEREVDTEIARVADVLSKQGQPVQQNLFGEGEV